MQSGQLAGIFLASRFGEALQAVDDAQAIAGRGLLGDRYFLPDGKVKPDSEVTLIEVEALEGLAAEHQITLPPHQSRRNLLTRGVALKDLVGKEFSVGPV